MAEFSDICTSLPFLTHPELVDLRARISARLNLSSIVLAKPATDEAETLVLSAICHTTRSRGTDTANVVQLQNSKQIAAFRKNLPALYDYLKKVDKRRITQHAILRVGLNLLLDDLAEKGLTPSARMLMQHIGRVAGVLDRNFPGYAQAGMLAWIVKASADADADADAAREVAAE